jgi:hypothetical protein
MDKCVGVVAQVDYVPRWDNTPRAELLGWCFPIECLAPVEPESRPSDSDTIAELRDQIDRLREQLAEATSPEGVENELQYRLSIGSADHNSLRYFCLNDEHGCGYVDREEHADTFGASRLASTIATLHDVSGPTPVTVHLAPPVVTTTYRGTHAQHEAAKAAGLEEIEPQTRG